MEFLAANCWWFFCGSVVSAGVFIGVLLNLKEDSDNMSMPRMLSSGFLLIASFVIFIGTWPLWTAGFYARAAEWVGLGGPG